jgi:hypothetical protein
MSLSADDAVELSRSIIAEFHRYSVTGHVDNSVHVMTIKSIITATCRHFPRENRQIEKSLRDYALNLFEEEWLRQAKEEEEEEYDREEEQKEASRVFLKYYRTEKDAW